MKCVPAPWQGRRDGVPDGQRPLAELTRTIHDVQLATLVKKIPPGRWSCELKWDGYRILAFKTGGDVLLMSRRHNDWTSEFSVVAAAVAKLSARECVLDSEVCAIDASGRPSFQLLQNRGGRHAPLVFCVFDLLWLDGVDLRGEPLEKRRTRLELVVGDVGSSSPLRISTAREDNPEAILAVACKAGMEGIVLKQKGSAYEGRRAGTWLKVKCTQRQEFAVVGYLPLKNVTNAVGSLLLALKNEHDDRFDFAGKVGTGFDDATRVSLAKLLDAERSSTPTAAGAPKFGGIARWSKPRHVAEVEFTEWTEAGDVRHPSFGGLREDKTPDECFREPPVVVGAPPPSPRATRGAVDGGPGGHHVSEKRRSPSRTRSVGTNTDGRVDVGGISISHPDGVLEPAGVRKLDLARYYEAVGGRTLPHVSGRPLTLLLYDPKAPSDKGGRFMRHGRAWGPAALRRVRIQEKTKVGEYLVVDDVEGLVALAQMDVLEVHTWNSDVDAVERPNRIVFDLDPAPDVPWARVIECAHHVRRRLADVGLTSWPKTTGGKGLHVVVPIEPVADWPTCLAFTKAFAEAMVRERPDDFVATLPKSRRAGKILLDYLRNNRTNTSIAAYSVRARPGAPVSVPVAWDEVRSSLRSDAFTMRAALERLKRRDPWSGYWSCSQRLPVGSSSGP